MSEKNYCALTCYNLSEIRTEYSNLMSDSYPTHSTPKHFGRRNSLLWAYASVQLPCKKKIMQSIKIHGFNLYFISHALILKRHIPQAQYQFII